jgi:hypothetical protein
MYTYFVSHNLLRLLISDGELAISAAKIESAHTRVQSHQVIPKSSNDASAVVVACLIVAAVCAVFVVVKYGRKRRSSSDIIQTDIPIAQL